jgi:molybdopterin synthase sulfur carrier subunit
MRVMQITILYFASLRETLGTGREVVELPAGTLTVGALRAWLCARGGLWAEALAEGRAVRVALDYAMASPETALHDGAELAFFPPVTGG